jgi:hypothetical protein
MLWRFPLGLLFLSFVCSATSAFAQVAPDAAQKDAPAPPDHVPIENAQEQFDRMAYGQSRNAAAARERLEALLGAQLDNLERICSVSKTQRKKIELAGKGDIKRFFDAIEEKRRQMQTAKGEAEIDRLQTELAASATFLDNGLFDGRSFFHKTMRKTLSEDQVARYQADRRAAREFRHRALVGTSVAIFERALGLYDSQRRALTRLLLSETRPPTIAADHRVECVLVLAQAVNVPRSRLWPILTNDQKPSADRFIAKLKEGLAGELKDFEAAERAAAALAEPHQGDSARIPRPERPKSAIDAATEAYAKNK